jgi:AcrR family transcriptional regulator
MPDSSELRADAVRNMAQIRTAAIAAFHGRGLGTPLEDIAAAAGVSKATIYNRFGGRAGLIDAVIGELVATELYAMLDRAEQTSDPWQAITAYVTDRRDLQYREPAYTDAMLMTHRESRQLVMLANTLTETSERLFQRAREAKVLRADFTVNDLYYADVANGLALRELGRPDRADYDRRTRLFIDSLRAP